MKWITHETLTGVIVYAVTDDLLLTSSAMVGAIVPDKLEGNSNSLGFSTWRSRHRGYSHWFLLYLLFIVVVIELKNLMPHINEIAPILIFFCIGAILHIIEDAICDKVPFILPSHKIGIKLFNVGSFSEYIIAIGLIILIYLIKLIVSGSYSPLAAA